MSIFGVDFRVDFGVKSPILGVDFGATIPNFRTEFKANFGPKLLSLSDGFWGKNSHFGAGILG